MKNKVKMQLFWMLNLIFILLLSGCAGTVKNMRAVDSEHASFTPENGKAMIVFMRPATLGFAIQSSVFELNEVTTWTCWNRRSKEESRIFT